MSLHARVTLLENGGDWMLGELTSGRRSCRSGGGSPSTPCAPACGAGARRPPPSSPTGRPCAPRPDRRCDPTADRTGSSSLAALAILLQLAISYFFNAIHKGGPTWRTGSAVHYVLYQDRMVTWFARLDAPAHDARRCRASCRGARWRPRRAADRCSCSPVVRVWTRRAAILAVIGLHLGFQCFINLGVFSWAMMGYTPFLLSAAGLGAVRRGSPRAAGGASPSTSTPAAASASRSRACWRASIVFARIRFVSSAEVAGRRRGRSRPSCSSGRSSSSTSAGRRHHARRRRGARSCARSRWASSGSGRCASPACARWRTSGYDLFARRRTDRLLLARARGLRGARRAARRPPQRRAAGPRRRPSTGWRAGWRSCARGPCWRC